MDNTKVKRVRKAKVPKVEEPIEETVYEPLVEEKTMEPIIDQTVIKTRKNNAWIEHVRAYRVEHPEISYTVAMKEAKQSYKR
jgi:hypothetical protein